MKETQSVSVEKSYSRFRNYSPVWFWNLVTYCYTCGFVLSPKARSLYRALKAHQKDPSQVIFRTLPTIGDTVYELSHIAAYRKVHPEKNITIVACDRQRDIVEAFSGYDEVIYLPANSEEWGLLRQVFTAPFYLSLSSRKRNIYLLHFCGLCNKGRIEDLHTIIRKTFSLPRDASISFPNVKAVEIRSIPDFERKKERIAVLNPYASNFLISPVQTPLERIAELLAKAGYHVYSNVIGEQEPIRGSESLTCPINEFYRICDRIPLVVSVRSGILDWAIATRSQKFVIYSKTNYGTTLAFRQNTLAAWGRPNVKEVNTLYDSDIVSTFEAWATENGLL